jgi:hypothetical protein
MQDCPTLLESTMPITLKHYGVRILTLESNEIIQDVCEPGDIVLEQDSEGWWTRFVTDTGEIESYDSPFENYQKAMWTAKAAAEFQAEEGASS